MIYPGDITDDEITSLRLAVDLCTEAERAEQWKDIATALASALQISGWMPHSGGSDALEAFKRLRRQEYMASVLPQPKPKLDGLG